MYKVNEKLVQLYVEGMEKDYLTHWGSWQNYGAPQKFVNDLLDIEWALEETDETWKRKESVEWERAKNVLRRKKLDELQKR